VPSKTDRASGLEGPGRSASDIPHTRMEPNCQSPMPLERDETAMSEVLTLFYSAPVPVSSSCHLSTACQRTRETTSGRCFSWYPRVVTQQARTIYQL